LLALAALCKIEIILMKAPLNKLAYETRSFSLFPREILELIAFIGETMTRQAKDKVWHILKNDIRVLENVGMAKDCLGEGGFSRDFPLKNIIDLFHSGIATRAEETRIETFSSTVLSSAKDTSNANQASKVPMFLDSTQANTFLYSQARAAIRQTALLLSFHHDSPS
jgi:hypothetical protein